MSYSLQTTQRHSTLSTIVWMNQELSPRVSLIYLAGMGFSRTTFENESRFDILPLPPGISIPNIFPAITKTVTYGVRPLAGFEGRIGLTEHVDLVPGIRLHGLDNGWLLRPPWASRGISDVGDRGRPLTWRVAILLAGGADGRNAADVQTVTPSFTHQRRAHGHSIAGVLVERGQHELQRVLAVTERRLDVRRLALEHASRTRALRQLPLAAFTFREASDDMSEGIGRQLAQPPFFTIWTPALDAAVSSLDPAGKPFVFRMWATMST